MKFSTLILALPVTLAAMSLPLSAQAVTYDFAWYSGASQPWVYQAGANLFVDVYDDSSTPENDVFFGFRNEIDTDLGYLSSLLDLQIDTGNHTGMFTGVTKVGHTGDVSFEMHPVGSPLDLIDQSGAVARIAWSGEYAAGGLGGAPIKREASILARP